MEDFDASPVLPKWSPLPTGCDCKRAIYHNVPEGTEGRVVWKLSPSCQRHVFARLFMESEGHGSRRVLSEELLAQIGGPLAD